MQYQNTDSMYDYQNLILHELIVENWSQKLDDNLLFRKIISADLKSLEQMAYILIFDDSNQNKSVDFFEDQIIDTLNFMNSKVPFKYHNYTSFMDAPTLSSNFLDLKGQKEIFCL